jgi:hypothetical protein
LNQLPPEDRQIAMHQRVCPVTGSQLGSMGVPYRIFVHGNAVFLCCSHCEAEAAGHPDEIERKLAADETAGQDQPATPAGHDAHGGNDR